MGTHAFVIAKFDSDVVNGTGYVGSYVHYDGYVKGVGKTLFDNYQGDDAFAVASFGYMSSLPETPKELAVSEHANDDECVFFNTEEEVIQYVNDSYVHYVYLFEGGKWYVLNTATFNPKFFLLEDALK